MRLFARIRHRLGRKLGSIFCLFGWHVEFLRQVALVEPYPHIQAWLHCVYCGRTRGALSKRKVKKK